MQYDQGIVKRRRVIPPSQSFFSNTGGAVAAYQGPGDFATFSHWWGLRAYSSSQLSGTTAAIRIVKASDGSAAQDINILSTGALDTATINALGYAVKVTTIYDQTGNGKNLTQATLGNMPDLTIGAVGLGSGLPSLAMTNGSNQRMLSANADDDAQPYCMSVACIRRTNTTTQMHVIGVNGDFEVLGYTATSGKVNLYAGSESAEVDAANATWVAMNALFNGASSSLMVNGSNTTGLNPGAQSLSAGNGYFLCGSDAIATMGGDVVEGGIASTDISANFTSINNNQRAYWGF